jgi:hypothetical protein
LRWRDKGGELALQEISRKKPVLKTARRVTCRAARSNLRDKLLGDERGQLRRAFKAAKQALGKSQNKDIPRNRRRRHPRKRLGAKRLLHSDPNYEETLTKSVYCCRKVTGQEIPHF